MDTLIVSNKRHLLAAPQSPDFGFWRLAGNLVITLPEIDWPDSQPATLRTDLKVGFAANRELLQESIGIPLDIGWRMQH